MTGWRRPAGAAGGRAGDGGGEHGAALLLMVVLAMTVGAGLMVAGVDWATGPSAAELQLGSARGEAAAIALRERLLAGGRVPTSSELPPLPGLDARRIVAPSALGRSGLRWGAAPEIAGLAQLRDDQRPVATVDVQRLLERRTVEQLAVLRRAAWLRLAYPRSAAELPPVMRACFATFAAEQQVAPHDRARLCGAAATALHDAVVARSQGLPGHDHATLLAACGGGGRPPRAAVVARLPQAPPRELLELLASRRQPRRPRQPRGQPLDATAAALLRALAWVGRGGEPFGAGDLGRLTASCDSFQSGRASLLDQLRSVALVDDLPERDAFGRRFVLRDGALWSDGADGQPGSADDLSW